MSRYIIGLSLEFHSATSYPDDMFFTLSNTMVIRQFKQSEGITEQLKAENQHEWVAAMNNIRNRATEIVNHDIIYN